MKLHTTKRELSLWGILKSWRRQKINPECLIQRAAEIGITIEEDVSDEEINKNISDLCQQLKEIHKKSKEYRDEMLTNLANFSADIDDKKRAYYIRQMKKAERRNRVYSLLKFKQGKSIKGGVIERLKVPDSWPTLATYDENKVYQLKDPKTLT